MKSEGRDLACSMQSGRAIVRIGFHVFVQR
jgi:hypothetical protein